MYSSEQLKLLGFIFSSKPNINAQIDNIVQRAASRSFMLRHLANIHCNKDKLRNVYCSIIRSILEYSSVVYGPLILKYQANRLENVQKKCLRAIYGHKLSYEELLDMSDLAIKKFAHKAVTNPQFAHSFPLNTNKTTGRLSKNTKKSTLVVVDCIVALSTK